MHRNVTDASKPSNRSEVGFEVAFEVAVELTSEVAEEVPWGCVLRCSELQYGDAISYRSFGGIRCSLVL